MRKILFTLLTLLIIVVILFGPFQVHQVCSAFLSTKDGDQAIQKTFPDVYSNLNIEYIAGCDPNDVCYSVPATCEEPIVLDYEFDTYWDMHNLIDPNLYIDPNLFIDPNLPDYKSYKGTYEGSAWCGQREFETYSTNPNHIYSGPERVHILKIQPWSMSAVPDSWGLSVDLYSNINLDVFLMAACDPNLTLASSQRVWSETPRSSLCACNLPVGDYYLVVDSKSEAPGTYRLEYEFKPLDNNQAGTCYSPIKLPNRGASECRRTSLGWQFHYNYYGTTSFCGPKLSDSYPTDSRLFDGPEKVHLLDIHNSGYLMIEFWSPNPDLRAFIFRNCSDTNSLTAELGEPVGPDDLPLGWQTWYEFPDYSIKGSAEGVYTRFFELFHFSPGSYYIVVDGITARPAFIIWLSGAWMNIR